MCQWFSFVHPDWWHRQLFFKSLISNNCPVNQRHGSDNTNCHLGKSSKMAHFVFKYNKEDYLSLSSGMAHSGFEV
jgi:hypothetical protein